jgi:hypothetical protein
MAAAISYRLPARASTLDKWKMGVNRLPISLIAARVTNRPAVTQHCMAGAEINLANRRQAPSRIRKSAGAPAEVDFVLGYCQQRLRNVGSV